MKRIASALLALAAALLALAAALLATGCAAGFYTDVRNVTSTSATLAGVVASDRSEAGTYLFRYGPYDFDSNYPSTTPTRTVQFSARSGTAVSEQVGGLTPATVYDFELCADDQEDFGPFCDKGYFATTAPAGKDSATGAGLVRNPDDPCGGLIYSTAYSDADGRNVRGEASYCGFRSRFGLNCLRIKGDVAVLVYATGLSSTTGNPPTAFSLRLTDNGASGDRVERDLVTQHDTRRLTCDESDLTRSGFGDLGFRGDLSVIDAAPAG